MTIQRYKDPEMNREFNGFVDLYLTGDTGSPFWTQKTSASARRHFWEGFGDIPIFPARIPRYAHFGYAAYMAGKYCKKLDSK